jgi:hypothetical protein
MNKQQELATLDAAIKKLGADSYLGPWLSRVRHEVESAIRSDFFPALTLADAIKAGKAKADEILAAERAALAKEREELEAEKAKLAKKRDALELEKSKVCSLLNSLAERIWEV